MNLQKVESFVKKTFSFTKCTELLGESVGEYWLRYFSARRFPREQDFYVVYTSLDHDIPFQPDSARDYWLVNHWFIPTSIKLGEMTSGETFRNIRHAYVEIAKEGCTAFREVPTIMPRFTGRSRRALRLAQTLLKPINCAPSLHTAVPFFTYNLGARYFPEKEPELRQRVGDIVSTIIKTKLHALIDIAFGMFLAQRVIRDRLELNFYDLEAFFTQEQKGKDRIPYESIYRMYHEINELGKTKEGGGSKLPGIMESYFKEIGLPRVRREQSDCLYDLERKALVYSPRLKVGKGLF